MGLLAILPRKGDLSLSAKYHGIMMLEAGSRLPILE